ncbi:MAG TPA: DUF4389 domain-containing protein [Pseudonocardia sp.]|nr:DUF4389 domain-containing protein [Pseudonocardia sp.]
MTSVAAAPVRVDARLDTPLSRWLWLVKWLLVIPHVIVLVFLWLAFVVLTLVALVAIVITARYPRSIFDFNVGVLRWSWRVGYYSYSALGTDRYPPFTLGEVPDYPATLDIAYPGELSRGLALVKWWLLAIPHYIVLAFFVGGGTYVVSGTTDVESTGGLVALLVFFAAIVLLFADRYPRGIFDFVIGMNRWSLRVAAYAALMTDAYPPFRLDQGGRDPATPAPPEAVTAAPAGAVAMAPDPPGGPGAGATAGPVDPGSAYPVNPGAYGGPAHHGPGSPSPWSTGRIVSVVLGSLLLLGAVGLGVGGTTVLLADRTGRDADGFVSTDTRFFTSSGYALVFDPIELHADANAPDLGEVLGDVRIRATGESPAGVFVGIGPAAQVQGYLAAVERERLVEMGPGGRAVQQTLPGGAPATPPGQQDFWAAQASGPGPQQLTWRAAPGDWTVAVMNADGSRPVAAQLSAGVTAPALRWVWIGLYIGAGVALLAGALLVFLAIPRHPVPTA